MFSTLHTRDAVSVISRLSNMGVEDYLLAAVLRVSVAQRLVRKLCTQCRRKRKPNRGEAGLFEEWDIEPGPVWEADGCKACRGSGYLGRVGVFELIQMDDQLEEMVARGSRERELRAYLREVVGHEPMMADALRKVLDGLTSLQEIQRTVPI